MPVVAEGRFPQISQSSLLSPSLRCSALPRCPVRIGECGRETSLCRGFTEADLLAAASDMVERRMASGV